MLDRWTTRLADWLDRNIGAVFMVLVLLVLWLLFGPSLHGQASQVPNSASIPAMQPGDVLYIDTATSNAYLLWHAADKHYEIIAPYTQDQAFNLLLAREQYCWSVMYKQAAGSWRQPEIPDIPGVPKR